MGSNGGELKYISRYVTYLPVDGELTTPRAATGRPVLSKSSRALGTLDQVIGKTIDSTL
jgi:hypothetical protein